VDFLIVVGDFDPAIHAYQDYYAMWGFEVREDALVENQNLYFVMGNHDTPPAGDEFFRTQIAPFYPDNGPSGAPRGTIFSFDTGKIHMAITNQYYGYPEGGYTREQLNWIDEDLSASQQSVKFVFGHEPAFPMDRHVGDSLDIDPTMRDRFWSILVNNDVQAFFCGHTHHLSVMRNKGVYQIDAGEVNASHLNITIVEVDSHMAIARLYETDGSLPEPNSNDNVFNSNLDDADKGDEAYTIVFSSDFKPEEDPWWGCFIETVWGLKL
jgi:3',5'-cyclic AMP phosphodiesterase CpdA